MTFTAMEITVTRNHLKRIVLLKENKKMYNKLTEVTIGIIKKGLELLQPQYFTALRYM